MESIAGQPRPPRSVVSLVATLGMVVAMLIVSEPGAGAVGNTCRATNLTQASPSRSNLQAAINAADPGDMISVKGVCFGGFEIDKNLTLVGRQTPEGAKPVLHGEHGSGRVVDVAARVTLANLKVTGGLGRGESLRDSNGGGIIVRKGAALTLDSSVVRGNKAEYQGGGIANYGTLILNGPTSVTENVVGHRYEGGSRDGHGGGIVNYGTLRMNDSSSVRNNTGGNTGGGIRNYATLIMNGSSSVRANTAELGGGISLNTDHPRYTDPTVTMNDASSVRGNVAVSPDDGSNGVGGGFFFNDGSVTLKDSSSVRGNRAGVGGGLWFSGGAAVSLEDAASVHGNTAEGDGGGIDNHGGPLTMSGSSSVSGNTADRGGGIYNNGGTFTMGGSSSVSGNTASDSGGIFNTGTTTLEGLASVSENSADRGGGIGNFIEGALILRDSSTVHNNTATTGGGIYNDGDGGTGTINACDATSVDEWIGTVEPNDPSDFLDSDVSMIPSGTGGCS